MNILTTKRGFFSSKWAVVLLLPLAAACSHLTPAAVADKVDSTSATPATSATVVDGAVLAPVAPQEMTAFAEQFILIGARDGRWLRARDVDRYRCNVGVLICEAGVGRRSTRYCECAE
jgi:hypothetical protein